ncbi:polysaccharide pyruvyl transferase family protein [Aerococcus urinaeequi]
MKKAIILSFQFADNYGAVLQIYALSKVLEDNGIEVEVVDYNPPYLLKPYSIGLDLRTNINERGYLRTIKDLFSKLKEFPVNNNRHKSFEEFRKDYLHLTRKSYKTSEDLERDESLKHYDYYFVGSDQVWNPKFFQHAGNAYFLSFASSKKVIASYAASIAEKIEPKYEKNFQEGLKKFDFISVREQSAQKELEAIIDQPIEVTLDPTLLLNKSKWEIIADKNETDAEKFILVYDLVKDSRIISVVNEMVNQTGYKVISFSNQSDYLNWNGSFMGKNPTKLLKLFMDAEYVVTSSFHGTAFSLIFEKEFYTVPHPTRGSRMIDLLESLELGEKLVTEASEINLSQTVDYTKVNKILSEKRDLSLQFINEVINS